MQGAAGRLAAIAAVAAMALAGAATAHAAPAPQPYKANDAGGFLSVLPAGENGTDNALELAQFEADGQRPRHWDDQLPLYENLLYASPTLTDAQVPQYFKDNSFGVPPGDAASVISPRPDVTIVRDRQYGVPHVYGSTYEGTEFGAGYAAAQDRLFLMDVLRHTGRAELSSFAGGSASNREMDRTQWAIAPYTEADLQRQVTALRDSDGAEGRKLYAGAEAYVAGINAYIAAAKLNPLLMPSEYAALGEPMGPKPFTLSDLVATASLIGGIFGKGGGMEVDSAQTLQALTRRFGRHAGRRAWADFRSQNDPEAPTTIAKPFPYEDASPFARRGLAIPDRGSVKPVPVAPPVSSAASARSAGGSLHGLGGLGAELAAATRHPAHASNWELVAARHSADGHAIGVLGPQVGYYDPEILMEEDLHGPGIDARGASFPGTNLIVELGRGTDYAWSATTATSDNVDTFAEVLCKDDHHYLYKGRCLPMEKLVRHNSWHPTVADQTPAGSEDLVAWRTVHGIVYARGTVHGKPVAFVHARSTYFHEIDSILGFAQLEDPGYVHGPRSFMHAVSHINFLFNWAYVDADHIAYYMSGWMPQRAKGTSPDFPVLGTGRYDWKGYDPRTHLADWLPFRRHPHAVDPDQLVSWNNKQAPEWSAADDQWGYGPIYRQQLIADRVKAGYAHGAKETIAQLVQSMEEPATEDIRAVDVLPIAFRVLGKVDDPKLSAALDELKTWVADGGHRRDLNRDGAYEHADAVTLMDAWWPRLVKAEFEPALGKRGYRAVQRMLPVGDSPGAAPAFASGWWGYVSKDLRDLYDANAPAGAYSRIYCGTGRHGGGSASSAVQGRCRTRLLASLKDALGVSAQQLYGHGDCANDPTPACSDRNRFTNAAAVTEPPFPFQNRPTYQQVATPTRRLPR